MRIQHIITAVCLILVTALVACNDDKAIDEAYTDYLYDIVTYMGVDSHGMEIYRLENRNSEPAVTLLAAGKNAPNDSYLGRRVLLRYNFAAKSGANDTVRQITAYSVHGIISDSLRYTAKPLYLYLQDNSPMRFNSVWKTGNYINMHGQLEYTGRSRHFYMIIDSTTWHDDTVHCYMVHNVFGDTTRHWREFYGSFFVGTVWRNNPQRILRLHAYDQLHPADSIHDFSK